MSDVVPDIALAPNEFILPTNRGVGAANVDKNECNLPALPYFRLSSLIGLHLGGAQWINLASIYVAIPSAPCQSGRRTWLKRNCEYGLQG